MLIACVYFIYTEILAGQYQAKKGMIWLNYEKKVPSCHKVMDN